jgi:branched-chain amino acid aminotransferase
MNSLYFYVNGKYLNENSAKINVLDIGLLRGYGVFDFLVTYNNRPFLIDEHINRLFNSAKMIDLQIGKSKDEICKIILNTIQKNTFVAEKTIRIVITGGVGENSLKPSKRSSIIVIVQKKHDYPEKYYSKGVKMITYDFTRSMALAKSLDYSVAIRALKEARIKNAIEALYVDKRSKIITESTTSNIFIVKDRKIFTPKCGVLNGITRNLLIKLLKKRSPVLQKNITLTELFSSEEVFITASNKEVMPIVKIDGKYIGNGKVGPVTKSTINFFKDFIENGKW